MTRPASPDQPDAQPAATPHSAGPGDRPAVLITGANRGIGRAVAEELAADHHLILAGRDADALAALAAALPSAETFVAELTDYEATAAAVAALELPTGLAGLVHSAGILVNGSVEELSAAEWERNFAVNVTAVSELTRLLLPALRTARGTGVAVNSGSGFNAKGERGAWTDALRQEETGHGVRVSAVHPGRVDTDMQHELRAAESGAYESEKYLRPATVAAAIGFALRAPAEAVVAPIDRRPRAIG